jgi:hypothetical protein
LAIGLGVVGVAAVVDVVSNNNRANNTTPPPTTNTSTTSVNFQIQRPLGRTRALATTLTSAPFQPSSMVLFGAPFRGGTVGAGFEVSNDGLVGQVPLTRTLQVHAGAQLSGAATQSNVTQIDVGLDYLLSPNRALGAGLLSTRVDALTGGGSASTTPQVRYTIRF